MRQIRIYHPDSLQPGDEVELHTQAATHVTRVLRMQPGADLTLFNGDGREYLATLSHSRRNQAWVRVTGVTEVDRESSLQITLCQGISRGERMDFTIQKAVELGVSRIIPLMTERSTVHLDDQRLQKKHRHWQAVVVSACEQCGRNRIPEVVRPLTLQDWLSRQAGRQPVLVLEPTANATLADVPAGFSAVSLLIGPEGGISAEEYASCLSAGLQGIRLGPRILRTETAAVTALSIMQALWGDLGNSMA